MSGLVSSVLANRLAKNNVPQTTCFMLSVN